MVQAEASQALEQCSSEAYARVQEAGMCHVSCTMLLPLFDRSERKETLGVLELVYSHDLSFWQMHELLQPLLQVGFGYMLHRDTLAQLLA